MKTRKLLSVLLGGVVAGAILVSSTTTAERAIAQTPMEAAEEYFDALIAKDKDGMMFYSKDTNYLGVPSGKCGFTTLNYFFGNKNLASPTLSRRSKVS
ncbi:hypothetical protein AK95_04340 [Paenibacillus sp. LC231]|uniref:hypothetical protein n=1 Tax=Paenibacillus sp. LC231 TaxID=1120679 RepID=UPI0008DDBC26|nr:hypothetical protein [Paenibacillus sp. LC231]OIB02146.1 hypothetical protein AK95_04340 [Paenibacillus sp. LC231]